MSNINFKVGDIVRLKSGGPAMTVNDTRELSVVCIWFFPSVNGAWTGPETEYFLPDTLVKINGVEK